MERRDNRLGLLGDLRRSDADDIGTLTAAHDRSERMNRSGSAAPAPLLLFFLKQRAAGAASDKEVAEAIHVVESYIVRRLLSATQSQNPNRVMARAAAEIDSGIPLPEATRKYLSTGRKHYATDAQIRNAVATLPYYLNGRPNHRKLVLEWIEHSFGSLEPVDLDGTSIEHIMPQKLSTGWIEDLKNTVPEEELTDMHDRPIHTLGDLTLTGYNSSMSNSVYSKKRDELRRSGIRMNQQIVQSEQ